MNVFERITIQELDEDINYNLSLFPKKDLVINVSRRFLLYLMKYGTSKEVKLNSGELYYRGIYVALKRSVTYQYRLQAISSSTIRNEE